MTAITDITTAASQEPESEVQGEKVDLRQMFLNHQKQMISMLHRFRQDVSHPVAKGDGFEECWRKMLRDYLPRRYSVDTGFVVDHRGYLSEQIDIIIFDQQYSPFIFCEQTLKYVPSESVYAVVEVKPRLDKGMVMYAGKKAGSVRRLERTSISVTHIDGQSKRKPLHHILGGIVTLDSDWTPPLDDSFRKTIGGLRADHRLDLGCVLENGSFHCKYDQGSTGTSEPTIHVSEHSDALITFFLRLVSELQRIGTAPPIDISAWESSLSLL